jgi:DNA-binding response OmpR family regulator
MIIALLLRGISGKAGNVDTTGTHRILVVDDDPLVRWFYERALGRAGYTVSAVSDTAAALDTFKADRADIVITDMRMPGENGAGLVQRLREMADPPEIIVCSAFISEELRDELSDLGVRRFIPKPFRVNELLSAVQEAGT